MPAADFLPRTGQQRAPRELPPVSPFARDDGTCPPALADALATAGPGRLAAVVDALARVRVLVPVVAHEEHPGDADPGTVGEEPTTTEAPGCHDGERTASASLVTVRTSDGREALPVFSSVSTLLAWRADARPVPHLAVRTAMAAVDEAGGVLVLDAGSADPVVVPRPAVWALARGERWVPPLADGAVVAEIAEVAGGVDGVRRVDVATGARAEVKVGLAVVPGLTREEVQDVAARVAQALAESVVVAERVDSLELALTTA